MANPKTENLFLLEFLVDDLKLEGRCDCTSPGELCVSFQFLDNEALNVCEEDFNGENKFGENSGSKTGKSCLFSLTQQQAQKVLNNFDLVVSVAKKRRSGPQQEKLLVGSTTVSVLPLFLELINNPEMATCAKVLQDTYNLVDSRGMNVGKIGVYIRMSCYGKMIITQFQMNMNDKSVLFKDKDGHSLYRYKKSKRGKATRIEDLSGKNEVPPSSYPAEFESINQQMYPQRSQQMFAQNQYPPQNLNCPTTPCFPPNGQSGFPPNNPFTLNGPNPFPQIGPNAFPSSGQMGFPPQQMPPSFPPSNPNCPMQPCFPDYGQQEGGLCPAPSKPCQQVSFSQRQQYQSGCSGSCARG